MIDFAGFLTIAVVSLLLSVYSLYDSQENNDITSALHHLEEQRRLQSDRISARLNRK